MGQVVGLEVGVRRQWTMTTPTGGRRELRPHLRILDGLQVVETDLLGRLDGRRVRERDHRLDAVVDLLAQRGCRGGSRLEPGDLLVGERRVDLRQDPLRLALEDVELRHVRRDDRDELHRARGGADHRDPLTFEVVGPVPPGGVEHRALERIEPRDVGPVEVAEHADRADDTSPSTTPPLVSTSHAEVASSHRAPCTVVLRRMWGSRP